MEINSFIANFAEQFDETDVKTFTEETQFRNLEEWSSLLVMCIIAMIDEKYRVQLKGDDIKNANTIRDLFDFVKKENEK